MSLNDDVIMTSGVPKKVSFVRSQVEIQKKSFRPAYLPSLAKYFFLRIWPRLDIGEWLQNAYVPTLPLNLDNFHQIENNGPP